MATVVIKNGRVIDPESGRDEVCDVVLQGGKIVAIGDSSAFAAGEHETFDAEGKIVTAGLIDMHVHCYQFCTPIGIDPDHYCLGRGVTTAVDAGSAGATTLAGLKNFVAEKCSTRLLAFLNICMHGLASAGCTGVGLGGELDSLNQVNVDMAVKCIAENRDFCVGVKVRLSADAANDGKNEAEALQRGLDASKQAGVPLMTHHTFSTVPLEGAAGCPGALRKGDIYTHSFHGFPSTIIKIPPLLAPGACVPCAPAADTSASAGMTAADITKPPPVPLTVHPACVSARARGVLFDVGLGQGSFNWTVAETALREGFVPDVISTDLHSGGAEGPTYDLVTVMTRFLTMGMPLTEVIARTTTAPARAIGWADKIGSLTVGREADVSVLELRECDVQLEDCQGQLRRVQQRLVAVAAWRAGVRAKMTAPSKGWPNPNATSSAPPSSLLVYDGCC